MDTRYLRSHVDNQQLHALMLIINMEIELLLMDAGGKGGLP